MSKPRSGTARGRRSGACRGRGRARLGREPPPRASARSSVGFVMKPSSTRITGTSAQLKPVKSERSPTPRSGKPSARTSSVWTSAAARRLDGRRRRSSPLPSAGASVWVPRTADSDDRPRGRGGRARRRARFAIRARATFPMLGPAVRVLVMTTATPARRRSVRSRSETASDEVGLARPGDDAVRPSAVLDLPRRRARVRSARSRGLRARRAPGRRRRPGVAPAPAAAARRAREPRRADERATHGGGPTRMRIHTNVRITPGHEEDGRGEDEQLRRRRVEVDGESRRPCTARRARRAPGRSSPRACGRSRPSGAQPSAASRNSSIGRWPRISSATRRARASRNRGSPTTRSMERRSPSSEETTPAPTTATRAAL